MVNVRHLTRLYGRAAMVGAAVFLLMLPGILWLERAPYEKQKSPNKSATTA